MDKQVTIVSGATSGIGLATLETLCEIGHTVIGFGRSEEKVTALLPNLRDRFGADSVELLSLDVRQIGAVQAFVQDVLARHGRIDGLVNSAGLLKVEKTHAVSEESFDLQVDTMLKGTFFLTTAALPRMVEQSKGLVINVGSVAGLRASPKMAVYGAVKAAINNFTKSLALEYADQGIRTVCINPGAVETNLMNKFLFAMIQKKTPLKRLAQPVEIARLIGYLFSEDATYITGSAITIDGGVGL